MIRKYLLTKISISKESDWLVLVAVMLIYRPSAHPPIRMVLIKIQDQKQE